MKVFKNERDWIDLERADKYAILVGVLMWLALETGVYIQSVGGISKFKQIVKTEMVKHR